MRFRLCLALCFLASAVQVFAQAQPPYTTTNKLTWEVSNPATAPPLTPADAQALLYRYILDAQPAVVVVGVACVVAAPETKEQTTCSTALTAALVGTLNAVGSHSMTLQAFNAAGVGSGASIPFGVTVAPPPPVPNAPSNLRVTP